MSNPTIGNENQFQGPFNILPDPQLTNPTTTNNSQFTTPHVLGTIPTFNILPDYAYSNPTNADPIQFTTPIVLGTSHTYNILPDTIYPNPTTDQKPQFSGLFNYQSTKFPDPIYGFFKNKFSVTGPYSGNSSFDLTIPTNGTVYGALLRRGQNPTWTPAIGPTGVPNEWSVDGRSIIDNTTGPSWSPGPEENSNYNWGSFKKSAFGFGFNSLGSIFGVPQIAQMGNSLINHWLPEDTARYATFSKKQLISGSNSRLKYIQYPDFRNMRFTIGLDRKQDTENPFAEYRNQTLPGTLALYRIDGTAAALRTGNPRTIAYALASASPYGAYTIFNLDGVGSTGYGWGSHDSKYLVRNDFTLRSHVAKAWNVESELRRDTQKNSWVPTRRPEEQIMPFVGDRVNVIDFGRRTLKNAYQWTEKPEIPSELHRTQDFIKFYFSGPKLRPGLRGGFAKNDNSVTDDIIVFRATLGQLGDSFNPGWTSQTMIGRADPNYIYTGFSRDLSLDFTVYATSRDELFFIWRKLNALAGYTAPNYTNTIALEGPWMRLTVGDLFFQTPVVMNSLSYTLTDDETTWEINIEDDPTMMQVPKKVSVSCGFNVIGNDLPQKGGKFYTLAKRFDPNTDEAANGDDNWLSGFKSNTDADVQEAWRVKRREAREASKEERLAKREKRTENVPVEVPGN